MKVPFCDLNIQHRKIQKELDSAISSVINRGDFILGEDVSLFEKEFSSFCGCRYAVGVSSGTAALFLALKSLGIGEGDEVIVPDFTYIATALAVSYTGAKPVFTDIDEKTYNIDAPSLKKSISKNTKAVIPVHLYGQPADMAQVIKIAKEFNLKVVEDAAQAHGASIKMPDGNWKKAGAIGDIGCFSFYPSKNLGALGDGGMVVTDSEVIYKNLLMLRDYGRISKYEHAIIGYNSRLDTLQAAILMVKLKKLDEWNNLRYQAALLYNESLGKMSNLITPYLAADRRHVYHVYAIRAKNRDRLIEVLKDGGVSAIVHYPLPLHLQKAYLDLGYKRGDFAVSERISKEIISLPIYPYIEPEQVKYVCELINKGISL